MVVATLGASAQDLGIFNHLGLGVGVGTTGISVEAAAPVTSFVQMRAGVAFMPDIKFHADADVEYSLTSMTGQAFMHTSEARLRGNLGRVQGSVIFNVYPIPRCNFFVAVGAYFGGNDLLKIDGHCDDMVRDADGNITIDGQKFHLGNESGVVIGDYKIPVDKDGNVSGGIKVKSFRPYFGLGFGRSVPGKLLAFNTELGVQIHGKPELYTNNGELEVPEYDGDDTFHKIMDKVKVYPTLTFRLSFRAF